jgi:four helix bundle protein
MTKFALESLKVYAMAEELADLVWNVASRWDSFARSTIGHQIVRAADSVGANIAEGYGRASPVDHKRFVRIARGSLYETRHFVRRADKRGLIAKEDRAPLRHLLENLPPALNGYLRSLGANDHGSS